MSNSQRRRECDEDDNTVRVDVYDSSLHSSFDVQCNRTKCNSVETYNRVKAILASYNLTDANGRIPASDADIPDNSNGHGAVYR